jgi:uncharacterized iron-regulated membrane protein
MKRPTPELFGEVIAEGGYPEHYGGAFDVGGKLTDDGTLLYRATGRGYWADTSTDYVDRSRGFFAPALTWQPDEDTSLTVLANLQYDRTGWVAAEVGPATLYFDSQDGRYLGDWIPWRGTGGDLFLQLQFPLHSGRIAGLPGRIFVSALGLVVAIVAVTGVIIWLRKRRARLALRRHTKPVADRPRPAPRPAE